MALSQKEILRRTIEALEASLQRFPESEKIIHQLALAYAQTGRFDPRAIQLYQTASDLFPSDYKVQQALSIGFLVTQSAQLLQDIQSLDEISAGSLERNIERLAKLTKEFPDSPHIHRALGDLKLIQGQDREALQHYKVAMALGLTDLPPLCNHFEMVRNLREVSGHAGVFFADIYQRMGFSEKAEEIYRNFLSVENPERIVLEKYGEFLQRRLEEADPSDEATLVGSIQQLARISLVNGNVPEALVWARQISTEQLAKDHRLARDLARRLMAMEDFRSAFDYVSKVPLDDESKGILNEMTVMLEKRGELDTAVYILQFINDYDDYSREPRDPHAPNPRRQQEVQIEIETELQMAELHWKNRRWAQAFERYLRVLELGYDDYRSLLEPLDLVISRLDDISPKQLGFLSNFFAERRDWRRSLNYAAMALQIEPSNPGISARLQQACERILLEYPDDYDVRLVYGDEHLRLGNLERAMQEYRRCAEAPEYKMKANRRLALANFRAGDLLGSFKKYTELPILEIEDLERLYDLAIAFANTQQYKEAFETAKLVREYDERFRDIVDKYNLYEEKMNESNVGFVIDPKMRELIGDHSIGRYKYVGKIGSGGMGVVHKVVDLKSNTVVAMKILREGLSSSGKAIDRFFREARIAATLHHRNIVNILDYNISNNYGQSYIAMEFVDGPSLRDVIEKKFSETVDIVKDDILQALDWISQLCDALDATHKKGIIHRDIKPDNVMLGPGDVVKITDFGIVHIEEATFTPTGALIGTPRYMSPEQVHGGRIDARSDIYAVGIILYELLIGSPPFISGDISYQQVNVAPTPPREICATIPQAVDRIIMKCLEKAPSDRYQSSLECKQDVDEAYMRLGGNPQRRRPDAATTASGFGKPTPRAMEGGRSSAPSIPLPSRVATPKLDTVTNEDHIETPSAFLQQPRHQNVTREVDVEKEIEAKKFLDSEFDLH